MDPYGLENIPYDEIIKELDKRYPHGVVVMVKNDPDNKERKGDWQSHFNGSFENCLALIKKAEWLHIEAFLVQRARDENQRRKKT